MLKHIKEILLKKIIHGNNEVVKQTLTNKQKISKKLYNIKRTSKENECV